MARTTAPAAEPSERTSRPESELLARAARGDEIATRLLYRQHVDVVQRTATRVLGSADGDVDDVVQRTFLAALDGAATFDGRSKLSTWLCGIATRRALDLARARARRGRWSALRAWAGLPTQPESRPDARVEGQSVAERALASLSLEQRTVFLLHQVEGHTLQEISEMLGVGVSTLHARLVAARKRLDGVLADLGEP